MSSNLLSILGAGVGLLAGGGPIGMAIGSGIGTLLGGGDIKDALLSGAMAGGVGALFPGAMGAIQSGIGGMLGIGSAGGFAAQSILPGLFGGLDASAAGGIASMLGGGGTQAAGQVAAKMTGGAKGALTPVAGAGYGMPAAAKQAMTAGTQAALGMPASNAAKMMPIGDKAFTLAGARPEAAGGVGGILGSVMQNPMLMSALLAGAGSLMDKDDDPYQREQRPPGENIVYTHYDNGRRYMPTNTGRQYAPAYYG